MLSFSDIIITQKVKNYKERILDFFFYNFLAEMVCAGEYLVYLCIMMMMMMMVYIHICQDKLTFKNEISMIHTKKRNIYISISIAI